MGKQTESNFCVVKDDMEERYPKVLDTDTLMASSSVYLARLSGHLASVKEEYGLKTARGTAKSMLDLARIVKAGKGKGER